MDEFLGGLLAALLEFAGEFLIEMLFELAAEALSAAIIGTKKTSPKAGVLALAAGGAGAGLLSAWLFPHRLTGTRVAIPGISLLIAPLATGLAMDFLGKRLRGFGRYPGALATFRGGVLFAFFMALLRWWFVSR